MSGDRLRDEADSFREALPDDVIDRAVRAACDVADWHWEPEYNGEHVLVPSPEASMEPIVLAVIDSIGPTVAAQVDAAREQDLAAIEAQIAEHVGTRTLAAVARAEAADQAVQRVRELADQLNARIKIDGRLRGLAHFGEFAGYLNFEVAQ